MKIHSRSVLLLSIDVMFFLIILASCVPRTTPQLTALPTTTLTLLSTPTATSKQSFTSTPIIYATQVYGLLISPDGTKRIQSYDWKTFDVLSADGTVLWSITYDVNKFGSDTAAILLEAGYSPIYWSKDGKYICLTCHHGQEIDTSGKYFGNEFIDGCGVFKFDVDTGEMQDILPEITPGHGYYAFSISPDEKQLVYTYQNEIPVKIKLLDLNTSEERVLLTADEKILETGRYGWSPQGDKLIFMTLEMSEDEKRFYSIFILDLKSLKVQLIVKDLDMRLSFESWNEQGVVSYKDDDLNTWRLSVESEALLLSTKTPWPTLTPSSASTP